MKKTTATADDILAAAAGASGVAETRALFAAALADQDLRARVGAALPAPDEQAQVAVAEREAGVAFPAGFAARLRRITERFAPPPLGARLQAAAVAVVSRLLAFTPRPLTLPCLSPALAAPELRDDFAAPSFAVTTDEGVRITFQQLPSLAGDEPVLRVFVDAAAIQESGVRYRVARIVLGGSDADRTLDIPIADAGGYADFPAASLRGAYRLESAALSSGN